MLTYEDVYVGETAMTVRNIDDSAGVNYTRCGFRVKSGLENKANKARNLAIIRVVAPLGRNALGSVNKRY